MGQEKILVPLRAKDKQTNGLYHALSLARRINAKIFILQIGSSSNPEEMTIQDDDVLYDIMNVASHEGLEISYHVAGDDLEEELQNIITQNLIEVVIVEDDQSLIKSLLKIRSRTHIRIIQVRDRNKLHYI